MIYEGFEYSSAFVDRVVEYYGTHDKFLVGPESRIRYVADVLIPELETYVGDLDGVRVADFGCGTASSTVALRAAGATVEGYDIDETAVSIGQDRLKEHGFEDVVLRSGPSAAVAGLEPGVFDVVYLNAVLEHVPIPDRPRVLADAAALLRPGGHLALAQSPNRWWPRDVYLTGLWFLPWLPSGSRLAARYASSFGRQRHSIRPTPEGGRALELRGVPGITYPATLRALPPGTTCRNAEPHRRSTMSTEPTSRHRRLFERFVATCIKPLTGLPVAAFVPMFSLLVFRIPDAPPGS